MYLNRARRVTDVYTTLMLGVFPLFWGFEGYDAVTESKFWFFVGATGLWLLAAAALLVAGAVRGERYAVSIRAGHLFMGLFLVMGAFSAVTSEFGAVCFLGASRNTGYLTTVLYALVFFGVSWLGTPRREHIWAMAVAVTVSCVIAIFQLLGHNPLHLFPEGTNYYDKYVLWAAAFLGSMGNVGTFSAHLCLCVPVLTAFALRSPHKRDKLYLLPAALGLVLMALCEVEAGLLGTLVSLLVSLPALMRSPRRTLVAGCVSGGVTLTGLGTLYFWPGSSGTLWEMSRVLHGELLDSFGSHRGQIWKRCWELFGERPWLGHGPGTAAKILDITWEGEYYIAHVDNTHNVYLGHLIEIGLVGALAYVAAAFCAALSWLRRRDDDLVAALGCGFIAYLVQDFFGLGLSLTAPMLFVLWGLLESEPLPPC